jgi:hypothetical protein
MGTAWARNERGMGMAWERHERGILCVNPPLGRTLLSPELFRILFQKAIKDTGLTPNGIMSLEQTQYLARADDGVTL